MTEVYNTPEVLHIVETDEEGNKRTIRYFREDRMESFCREINRRFEKMTEDADIPEGRKINENVSTMR